MRKLIAGNWKMNGLVSSQAEIEALISDYRQAARERALEEALAWVADHDPELAGWVCRKLKEG